MVTVYSTKTGTAKILAGDKTVLVPHGLSTTPTLADITVTPLDDIAPWSCWPSNPDATNFTINISSMDTKDHDFSWGVIYEVEVAGVGTGGGGVSYCLNSDVKAYSKIAYTDLGYASDADFNTFLDSLIVLAQSMIENFCRVPIAFFNSGGKTFTSELHDYGYPWISLSYYPVLSVSKVEYNDQGYGITANWVTVTEPDYIMNLSSGQLMLVNKVPAIVEQSIRVSYTAGFSSTPDDIKQVCIQVCCNMLHGILQRKVSPQVQVNEMVVKLVAVEAFNEELKGMLRPYVRRLVIAG
jgi:hypothetical protein